MDWETVCATRRWMPIGRRSDPKAPAEGYQSAMPDGGTDRWGQPVHPWLIYDDVPTKLAGLNFGPVDGLVGIDLDFKPGEAPDDAAVARARQRLGEIRSALSGLGLRPELSHSGQGMHFFAASDDALLDAIRGMARIPVPLVAGRRKKAVAACEIFGGGNAYIAVTDRWVDGSPPGALAFLPLDALRRILPEWSDRPVSPPPAANAARPEDEISRLTAILQRVPVPADYDTWLRCVSAALNSGIDYDAIVGWSQTGSNYHPGEIDRKVGHQMRYIGAGWLIRYAQAQGVYVAQRGGRGGDSGGWERRNAALAPAEVQRRGQEFIAAWEAQAAMPTDDDDDDDVLLVLPDYGLFICDGCLDALPAAELRDNLCRLCHRLRAVGFLPAE